MGTPLQRRERFCRSEACSPYLGQKLAIRRQVPPSARTLPCAGHTLPWQAETKKNVLLFVRSVLPHQQPNNAPVSSSSICRLSCAPSVPEAAAATTNKKMRRGSSGTQKETGVNWEGQTRVGLSVCGWRGEKRLLRSPPLEPTISPLSLSLSFPVTSWARLKTGEKFQRLASGKDPAHSVETLGGSGAERASSKQRQCSGEQAAVCRSRLSRGLHEKPGMDFHIRADSESRCVAGD